eukprot:4928247-Amphidinium_carterae.1
MSVRMNQVLPRRLVHGRHILGDVIAAESSESTLTRPMSSRLASHRLSLTRLVAHSRSESNATHAHLCAKLNGQMLARRSGHICGQCDV